MTDPTETAVKGNPPGLLRRILWWLWVILLSVLLVFGLVFAAPWKAITLVAIFLAAATILPKKHRKWFWRGVGVVVIALVVWVFLPEDGRDWRPYTFDEETAELQTKYAVPDSENAAVIYNQILKNWKQKEPNEPNLPDCWFDLVRKSTWLSKDQPEIAAYIKYHKDTIDGVLQAVKFEKCSFPIVTNFWDLGITGRSSATRQWARLLIAAGNNDLAKGNINDALEKYLAILRMGQHFSRQPSAIDMLVGVAIEALSLGRINNLVISANANEQYLSKVEQAVSEIHHDWNSDLTGFIDSEKLMIKNMLGGLFYEVNPQGKTRLSRDFSAVMREQAKESLSSGLFDDDDETNELIQQRLMTYNEYWWKRYSRLQTILFWFYVPESPEKLGHIIDTSFEKHYEMAKPDFDWSKKPQPVTTWSPLQCKLNLRYVINWVTGLTRDTYFRLHDTYLRHSSQKRATLLIIALRRFKNANGSWPEKLEDIIDTAPAEILIDPVNDDFFVYKRTKDNFTLYSKGKNSIDEGGEFQSGLPPPLGQPPKEPSPDDRMIWPIRQKNCNDEEKGTAGEQDPNS